MLSARAVLEYWQPQLPPHPHGLGEASHETAVPVPLPLMIWAEVSWGSGRKTPSRDSMLRRAQSHPPCLMGGSDEAPARSVARTTLLSRLFWCRWAAKPQTGPALAGKGGCWRGTPGPRGRAGPEGLAAAAAAGRCAKAEAGRLPRTFQCIHIIIRGSRARASLPAARVGWEWRGWRWG